VIAGYAVFQLKFNLNQNQALKIQLSEILKEKGQLQSQIKEANDNVNSLKEEATNLKKSLEEKEKQTIELKKQTVRVQVDAQNFREELIKAKIRIEELDDELKFAKSTNSSLEKTGLKSSKRESSRKDSQEILSLRREVTQLSEALEAKDNEFVVLEARLKNVTEKYLTLDSANKFLEKQIEQLKTERLSLQEKLNELSQVLGQEEGDKEKARELKRKIEIKLEPLEPVNPKKEQ
jgi:chromosome segregation ATPase